MHPEKNLRIVNTLSHPLFGLKFPNPFIKLQNSVVFIFLCHLCKCAKFLLDIYVFNFNYLKRAKKHFCFVFICFLLMFRVTYKQQIKTKIMLMMALSNNLASKHKFQEKTPHIFDD